MMQRRTKTAGLALVVGVALAQVPARAEVLITPQEAMLPPAPQGALIFRGVTRGPKIELVAPVTNTRSPLHFQLKFESHGGASIDPGSLKITYLKNPAVDLTPRVKFFTQAAGIDMPTAEVPPGNHDIRIDVTDSRGRVGSANLTLKVTQ